MKAMDKKKPGEENGRGKYHRIKKPGTDDGWTDDAWPIQAVFWLEWGSSITGRIRRPGISAADVLDAGLGSPAGAPFLARFLREKWGSSLDHRVR
jgi:hypothetical protein